MAEIIDFKKELERREAERPVPGYGDEVELSYDPRPDSVAVTLLTDEEGMAHFKVTAPASDVGSAIEAARIALAASFGVDPSEAMLAAVRQTMGAPTFDAYITTFVQQRFFSRALLRTGVLPFLDPDFLTSDAPVEDADYTFEVDTLLRPTLELSSYDPVRIVPLPEKPEVTSRQVGEYLDRMSEELATWEEDASRTQVETGDHVTLNLDSSIDGKPVRELTGRHIPFVVGLGALGGEFDAQLVGMKPRERKTFTVGLPAANPDGTMGEQQVLVKAQLDTIQKQVPARIDDAWVMRNMPEAQTLLGLRSRVRDALERAADEEYHEQLMQLTADKLAERLVDDPDERYFQKMRDELVTQFVNSLAQQGVDYQQYMAQPDFDRPAWEAEMTESARQSLRRGLALDSLADHLDIKIDETDIVKVVAQMAPGREEQALQSMVESGQMPRMCEVALRLRANEWLVDQALRGPRAVVAGGRAADAARETGDAPKLVGIDGGKAKAGRPKLTLL